MLFRRVVAVVAAVLMSFGVFGVAGADDSRATPAAEAFAYWTPERVASAVPRDLVIDHRGLGYLRSADGGLQPHGHSAAAVAPPLTAIPLEAAPTPTGPESDAATPLAVTIGAMSPDGVTIGASHTFTARMSSPAGIRQVTAFVGPVGGAFQQFRMSFAGSDAGGEIWQLNLQGFTDGDWNWYIEVRDKARGGGDRATSDLVPFTVSTSGGGDGSTVTNARWTGGGDVQTAAGRILFTMPGGDYVCSGTAVTDATTGRSIILTAAHCIYDDVAKVFSSNAIFIPSQDDGGTDRTDSDCTNDPLGCWSADHGVVDLNWTIRTFPDNIQWDYGYYVVSDSGAHSGTAPSPALDAAAGSLAVDFTAPATGLEATALGYSYSDDPYFMYCQEPMGTNGFANYWLDSCDLSGGSSGGPWMQPLDGGNGSVISVNSWGYTTRAGMAGPKLHDNSAQLLFDVATSTDLASADRGFVVDPNNPPGSTTTTVASGITLSVTHYKVRGVKTADLAWSGATGSEVDIYRDGAWRITTSNEGAYRDSTGLKGGGSNTWQVCESGTNACSSEVTVDW